MANVIKTLHDVGTGDVIFPRTKRNAISDENGNTLGNLGFLNYVEVSSPSQVVDDFNHPIGTIYETTDANFNPANQWGGTWTLIGTKKPIGNNVFGNGKTLGLYDNANFGGTGVYSSGDIRAYQSLFGGNVGGAIGGSNLSKGAGVPTKSQLDNGVYPYENTGLIVDSIDCYTWRRVS